MRKFRFEDGIIAILVLSAGFFSLGTSITAFQYTYNTGINSCSLKWIALAIICWYLSFKLVALTIRNSRTK